MLADFKSLDSDSECCALADELGKEQLEEHSREYHRRINALVKAMIACLQEQRA